MAALDSSIALFEAERQVFLERPKDVNASGDIEGSVKADWLRLKNTGYGVVRYRDKKYVTIPLGSRSIARGTPVEMTFANGVYFTKW